MSIAEGKLKKKGLVPWLLSYQNVRCSPSECEDPFEGTLNEADYKNGVGDITGPVYFAGLNMIKVFHSTT